jgi:hypothetical protein
VEIMPHMAASIAMQIASRGSLGFMGVGYAAC